MIKLMQSPLKKTALLHQIILIKIIIVIKHK